MNLLEDTRCLIKNCVRELQLPEATYEHLKEPRNLLRINIPVFMDDGSVKTFLGYRSQHNNALGPYKGGIRFHPDVTQKEVIALSIWMSIKCAVVNIPYGGGKGGIIVDPTKLSRQELEKLARGYMSAVIEIIGPRMDIPAPDVNTNPQIIAWMADEYSRLMRQNEHEVITGKPLEMGGSQGRIQATSRGCIFVAQKACEKAGININGARVVIQGFGNVGGNAALLIDEVGAKVIAVSDSAGGIFNSEGFNVQDLYNYYYTNGTFEGYHTGKLISNKELLELECEILIPAALENVITRKNVENIKSRIIVEAANGPTTAEADSFLTQKGILICPDVLANAGGVVVSYLEWVQGNYHFSWKESIVNKELESKMVEAFQNVYEFSKNNKISMRKAAYMLGIKRIAEVMMIRGWI